MHQIAGCLHGEWRRCCKPRDLSTTLHTYAQVICVRERHRQHIAAASPTLSNRRSRNRFPASSHFHFPTQPLNVSLSASASQSHKPSTSEVRHSHCIPFSCCLTFYPFHLSILEMLHATTASHVLHVTFHPPFSDTCSRMCTVGCLRFQIH